MVTDKSVSYRSALKGVDDDALYGMASKLSDKGYGNFDKCLSVLIAQGGDMKRAEEKLSNLMFEKNSIKRN